MLWSGEHSAQKDQWVTQEPRGRECGSQDRIPLCKVLGLLLLDSHDCTLTLVLALSGRTEMLGGCFHGPLSCSGEISTS